MKKFIILFCLMASLYSDIPNISNVLELCDIGQYQQAKKELAYKWDNAILSNKLSYDDIVTLHFLGAWIEEKMGNSHKSYLHINSAKFIINMKFLMKDN